MADRQNAPLGAVQETLFVPLAARAREAGKKRPIIRDPKAEQIDTGKYGGDLGGVLNVLRTAIIDHWAGEFLAGHPAGTVIELGTGLNARFDRVDNGQVHWIDLDLPGTIELRRRFFSDSARCRMVAASVLDDDWMCIVEESQGPYFFAAEGLLAYLEQAPQVLARIAGRFPGALIAFDTEGRRLLEMQHRMAARKHMEARWAWSCDDPRSLEPLGLRVLQTTAVTRPPRAMRARLPLAYRYLLPLASRILGGPYAVTLFRTTPLATG